MQDESESSIMETNNTEEDFKKMIDNEPWAQQFWIKIQKRNKITFYQWCKTVKNLAGKNTDCIFTWTEGYLKVLDETLTELETDMNENYKSTIVHIESLLKILEKLCSDLHLKMPSDIGENKLSLFEEKISLAKQVKEYQTIADSIKIELKELEQKQEKLCKILGHELTFKTHYSPLPTSIEMEEYRKCIQSLEHQEFERSEQFYDLKEKCVKLSTELRYEAENDFETNILCSEWISLTADNMRKLKALNKKLENKHESMLEEISHLRNKVEDYWKILDIDLIERDGFRSDHSKNDINSLLALKEEFKKCELIRNANMKIFVERLRIKLEELWKKCHCSENDKSQFSYFKSDCYTEDLLDLHEMEIQRWEVFYEENKALLSALEKYQELCKKELELEENAAASTNRYKNRGGTLLQEEKERNKLKNTIPMLETKITILSQKYLEDNGIEFLTFGKTAKEIIEEKNLLRKNNRKTRLNIHSTLTPLVTPNKRKLGAGTPVDFKRSRVESARRPATPRFATSKIKLTCVPLSLPSQRRRSRSIESAKKKTIRKPRRSKSVDISKNEYRIFQTELSRRDECRSTIIPEKSSHVQRLDF